MKGRDPSAMYKPDLPTLPSSFPVSCAQPNCATHAFLFLFIKLWILAKFIADYMDILAYFIVKHYKMTRNDSLLHNISIFLIDLIVYYPKVCLQNTDMVIIILHTLVYVLVGT